MRENEVGGCPTRRHCTCAHQVNEKSRENSNDQNAEANKNGANCQQNCVHNRDFPRILRRLQAPQWPIFKAAAIATASIFLFGDAIDHVRELRSRAILLQVTWACRFTWTGLSPARDNIAFDRKRWIPISRQWRENLSVTIVHHDRHASPDVDVVFEKHRISVTQGRVRYTPSYT
jgi:hypothetical protein